MNAKPIKSQQGFFIGIGLAITRPNLLPAATGGGTGFFLLADGASKFLLADGASKLRVVS